MLPEGRKEKVQDVGHFTEACTFLNSVCKSCQEGMRQLHILTAIKSCKNKARLEKYLTLKIGP